jgi:hypothetical protein
MTGNIFGAPPVNHNVWRNNKRSHDFMPELRDASGFGTRTAIRGFLASLLGVAGIAFVVIRALTVDHWTIAGGVVFGLIGLALAVWSFLPGRFHCPECGLRLRRPIRLVGPLQYHCRNCNVIWDTGVQQWTGGD